MNGTNNRKLITEKLVYLGKEGEKILCSTCLWNTKRKDNLKKGLNFFVKVKEDD